jgi:hypothetical protein
VAKRKVNDEDKLLCYGPRAVNVSSSTQITVPNGALADVGITGNEVLVFGDRERHVLIVAQQPSAEALLDLASRTASAG